MIIEFYKKPAIPDMFGPYFGIGINKFEMGVATFVNYFSIGFNINTRGDGFILIFLDLGFVAVSIKFDME